MELLFVFMWLLVVHFVGDFVMQSDRVAKRKSTSNVVLFEHVVLYMVALVFGGLPIMAFKPVDPAVWPAFILLNGAAHFATDYVTSRINSRLWAEKRVHAFFVGIGADQLIHALTIGSTLALLMAA